MHKWQLIKDWWIDWRDISHKSTKLPPHVNATLLYSYCIILEPILTNSSETKSKLSAPTFLTTQPCCLCFRLIVYICSLFVSFLNSLIFVFYWILPNRLGVFLFSLSLLFSQPLPFSPLPFSQIRLLDQFLLSTVCLTISLYISLTFSISLSLYYHS